MDITPTGDGGSGAAPSGTTTGTTTPSTGGAQPAQQPTGQAEPTVYDLSDENALIKLKGAEKPVKFGEHVKGLQSQWTKAAQRAAQLEKQLKQREAELKQFQAQQRQAQQGGPQEDVFQALRALPYLSGEDAVEVVSAIGNQIQQRDMVILGLAKQLQQTQQIVNSLHQSSVDTGFDAKINKWLAAGGYPPEAAELAKELYLAYEGDDLDEEFPRIFSERWNQIEKIVEARRQAKVRDARPKPFLPGKGGDAKPSRPLDVKPNASPAEIADMLFPMVQAGSET